MYTIINGSQKIGKSNSDEFLKFICKGLDDYNIFDLKKDKYSDILESIKNSEVILFAFPLYVDAPSSILISFLDFIYDKKIKLKNKKVYCIINCGFREGEQNKTAENIMKQWSRNVGAIFASSILIGAGEVVTQTKYKFISKDVFKQLSVFADIIKEKKISESLITTVDILNNNLYCFFANLSWNKNAKKNKLTKKDIEFE